MVALLDKFEDCAIVPSGTVKAKNAKQWNFIHTPVLHSCLLIALRVQIVVVTLIYTQYFVFFNKHIEVVLIF